MMNNKEAGMSLIVKTITRITVGLILIYGIYIVLVGHTGPGGGFAGGVIIALSFIHLVLAFGRELVLKKINQSSGLYLAALGAFIFLSLASANFIFGFNRPSLGGSHFTTFSAGLIPWSDIAVSLMVGTGLFVIFLALVLLRGEKEE